MVMHGDLTTNADHPLTLGSFKPRRAIEGTVDPTIANQDSEMAMDIMRPTQAREMPVRTMKKEV